MTDEGDSNVKILRNFLVLLILLILSILTLNIFGWTIFFPVVLGIFIVYFVGWILPFIIRTYNDFYSLRNSSEATLRQIQVAMKLRLDMIEQLLTSVRNYSNFERDVFFKVTTMRSTVGTAGAGTLDEIDRDSQILFGQLLAVAENYPDLKASSTVLYLMNNITRVEQEIASHRYEYNNISRQFNTLVDTIPSNIIAKLLGFEKMEYLQFSDHINEIPGNRYE
jgi:LemA protein